MAFLCYVVALGLNLFWLLAGDDLSTNHQLIIPVLCVIVAGIGVLLRTRSMNRAGRVVYRRRARWVLLARAFYR